MDKIYEPSNFESRIYETWLKNKYFASKPNLSKQKFSIVMPPPNVTGKAHVGHALNNTIQDVLVRRKRMQGFEALWIPGTDHAAIATEEVLVKALKKEGLSKDLVGREEFIKRGEKWYADYGDLIKLQLQKLGISPDWDRTAFTMDENLCAAVRHAFVEYYKKGYIYRGKRSVNYCPSCRTTISDNENVYVEQNTFLWHIRYPFADGSGEVVIATTRPETLFGDTAVAVNPKDPRYKAFIGKDLILPLTDRKIKLIADDYSEMDFGTGAVKITPAHDPNDYEIGLRHNLDVIVCIDDEGKLTEAAGKFKGMDRIEARALIEEELKKQGFLVKVEKYKNKVGTCERCGSMTEPKISTQWFVKMEELAKPAIEVVKQGKVRFIPKRFEKQYLNWLENIKDWCISRQIWLGHRIPVFYCDACGAQIVEETDPTVCPVCGSKHLHQDPDVLDTWFSSALWPFSTLGYPKQTEELKYYYPTDVLVTGYDIITFWVSKMVFSGLEFMKDIPFKDVLINGIVRDAKGIKMSKHLGNGIDPIEMIAKYGADALRMSLINGMSMGTDLKYSEDRIKEAKIFINKIFNASKFVISATQNLKENVLNNLSEKDKWILFNLNKTVKDFNKAMDKYNLSGALGLLMEFFVGKFCDWYIELAKLDLYGEDEKNKLTTQNVLLKVLTDSLKMFHIFIPFVTEEIYLSLPIHEKTIMLSKFPEAQNRVPSSKVFDEMIKLIKAIRSLRTDYKVPDNKRTKIFVEFSDGKKHTDLLAGINKLGFGSEIVVINSEKELDGKYAKAISDFAVAYLPMNELVDEDKERERKQKEIESLLFEIQRSEKMLSNPKFVEKAPKSLVDEERNKLEKNKALLSLLKKDSE